MATLTVIVGYCGSGKSWWLEQRRLDRPDAHFMEEGAQVHPGGTLHNEVAAALRAGKDCFIGLMDCAHASNRAALLESLRRKAPEATIQWVFYENDVVQANENVCRDAARPRDMNGNIRQNIRWSACYDIPPGAQVLPIHALPRRGRQRTLSVTWAREEASGAAFTVCSLTEGAEDAVYLVLGRGGFAGLDGLKDHLAQLTGDDIALVEVAPG